MSAAPPRLRRRRVLVAGDVMRDRYLVGDGEPHLARGAGAGGVVSRTEERPGGAAGTWRATFTALGGPPTLLSVVGEARPAFARDLLRASA